MPPSFWQFILCCSCSIGFLLGVKSVEVDLNSQVVRILGSTPVKTMTEALEQTGRKARLIGQGIPEGYIFFYFIFHRRNAGFTFLFSQYVTDL